MARYSDRLLGAPPSKAIRSCPEPHTVGVPLRPPASPAQSCCPAEGLGRGRRPLRIPGPFPVRTQLVSALVPLHLGQVHVHSPQPGNGLTLFDRGAFSPSQFCPCARVPVLLSGRQAREFQGATREQRTMDLARRLRMSDGLSIGKAGPSREGPKRRTSNHAEGRVKWRKSWLSS